MTEGSDGFLARWSRRKFEVRREEAQPPAPEAAPANREPELTPEEIAALPKIEELTPETDISAFLRRGVPEALKNAALRRMWSLDPAVRDYVGDARDYAYDWNVPGGVPGNGPLLPTDDVDAMLRQMFPKSPPEPEIASVPGGASPAVSQSREPLEPSEIGATGREVGAHPGEPSPGAGEPIGSDSRKALMQKADLPSKDPSVSRAPVPGAESELAASLPRRRHGGAFPL
jgi:hypothetical protein